MNKFKKWISNYWYHYKFRTILCLFFAVIIGVTVFEFATKEHYDMEVYLYMSQSVSSDVENALEETVEKYFEENGETKNVRVVNMSYDPYSENGEAKMAHASQLSAEIRMGKNYIMITDEYRFEEMNNSDFFQNVFEKNDEFDSYDNKAFKINGKDFEARFTNALEKNNVTVSKMPKLYLSVIKAPEKSDKNYENYKLALELVDYITK